MIFAACLIPVTAGTDGAAGGPASAGGLASAGGRASSGGAASSAGGTASAGGSAASAGGRSSAGGSSGLGGGSTGFGGGSTGLGGGSTGFGGGSTGFGGGSADAGAGLACQILATLPSQSLNSIAIESPGALEVRAGVYTTLWTTRNFRFDFDGGSLGTFDETWAHSGAGHGSRGTNGRGLSLVLGGYFGNTQSLTLYAGQQGQIFTDVPDTIDWTTHDVVYNPERDEFALFWVVGPPFQMMMQSRFMDGGVGFTRALLPNGFLGKPDGVSWTPGGYFVLGERSLHHFAADGTNLQTVAVPGSPRSVASNRAGLAGASMESLDGGAVSFVRFDSQNGSLSAFEIRSGVFSSTSRIVWDPALSQWHVVYQGGSFGPFSVASFRESGQLVRNRPLGCSVVGQVQGAVLDGRSLFVATTDSSQLASHVLRVELQ